MMSHSLNEADGHNRANDGPQLHTRSQVYWNTVLKIPTQAAVFVVSVLVARILMPADFGILGVAMVLIGYANLFTDFGFSAAIVQRQIRDEDVLRSIFTFNLTVSAALAVGFSLSADFIANFFNSPQCKNVIVVMSSIFVITSFSAVPRAILNRDLDFKTLSIVDTASAVVTSLLTLVLALAQYGYWALALGQLIPSFLFTAYVCRRVKWVPAVGYRHASMSTVLDFGLWNVCKTQLEFVLGHVDKVFLGRFAGMAELGYYDKAQSIAAVPSSSFIASLNAVLFSSFSQRKDDPDDVRELLKKGLMTVSVLSFPVYAGLVVVARPFVVGLLGPKWAAMIPAFKIIALAFTVRSTLGFLVAVNVGLGQYKAYTIRYAAAGCFFVAACALLVSYGPTGIAVAFLLFAAVAVGLGLQLALSKLAVPWADAFGACWPAAKATVCMLAATVPVSLFLPGRPLLSLFVISVTGAGAYGTCLALETNPRFVALKRAMLADLGRLRGWD